MGPSLSGILFEFEGSKLNVSLNLLKWLIVLITKPISSQDLQFRQETKNFMSKRLLSQNLNHGLNYPTGYI